MLIKTILYDFSAAFIINRQIFFFILHIKEKKKRKKKKQFRHLVLRRSRRQVLLLFVDMGLNYSKAAGKLLLAGRRASLLGRYICSPGDFLHIPLSLLVICASPSQTELEVERRGYTTLSSKSNSRGVRRISLKPCSHKRSEFIRLSSSELYRNVPPPPPPDHLLMDSAPNLGPLISRKIHKFENCWYKSAKILEVLRLLFQQFLNLSSSRRDMSCPILGDLSNNMWSEGTAHLHRLT